MEDLTFTFNPRKLSSWYIMQKVKIKGHSIGSKVRVKTDGWTKGQTELGDCITSHDNEVDN